MITVKIKLRNISAKENKGTLYFQLAAPHQTRFIKTDLRIFRSEWDAGLECVRLWVAGARRVDYLTYVHNELEKGMQALKRLVIVTDGMDVKTALDYIETRYRADGDTISYGLFAFMEHTIDDLRGMGRLRTAETYESALNSFRRFVGATELPLDAMTAATVEAYQNYLCNQGLSMNTVSFYMRIWRATYNKAVDRKYIVQSYPFKRVYTGIGKTVKRSVNLSVIRRIKQLSLSDYPALAYARDLFLFSFYTRGMSFVDMAYLKKTDINNGILSYRRKKTGQQLLVRWEPYMQQIADDYGNPKSVYILPVLDERKPDERQQYKLAMYRLNYRLKILGRMLGLDAPLTLYVARHSWASAAHGKQIPLSVISEGMGHYSEKTTRIYLSSLDTAYIDNANSLIQKEVLD